MQRQIFLTARSACLLTAIAAATLVISCGGSKEMLSETAQSKFEKAKRRYDAGRYLEATEQFKNLLALFPGSKFAEPATFFLGKSRFEEKEYLLAEVDFHRIVRDFPRGTYAEEATFMLGMCVFKQRRPFQFDQSATERAILLFGAYLSTYPAGKFVEDAQERLAECRSVLAEKLHANGLLYLKLSKPKAARLSFEEVLEKYDDLPWADRALVGIARSYEQERNWAKAAELYEGVVEKGGDEEALATARDRLRKIKGKTGESGDAG
ncbi:MAG: outer membrane protein assembly factor BamD [Candidatus Eiseniibacteriota bacterium]|nr:MAG: outer membrane protein assembly factor BamD [Candidatus Eisenbacteria bacterium]